MFVHCLSLHYYGIVGVSLIVKVIVQTSHISNLEYKNMVAERLVSL